MTATERLRELLDERGVKYDTAATVISGTVATFWHDRDGYPCSAIEGADDIPSGEVSVQACITPEQAVEATLGSCNCSNSERTNVPCLPHFWTHDGALHVELPKLPESISVRLPDQRDREVGSARVWQYTRDSGTCHECAGMDDVFECSACGGRYEGWALKRWARYCPDCGRRIEVDG